MKKNLLLTLVFVLLTLLLCEFGLRKMNVYATYSERMGDKVYKSPFTIQSHGWYRIYSPDIQRQWSCKEFTHVVTTNSEGVNDKEWEITKPSSIKKRIAFFGDSFTEGIGATGDSSFPAILRRNIDSIETMNCGVAGSDPVFEYVLFRDRILKYKPDEVYVGIVQTDIWDAQTRGGFERFNKDSTVKQVHEPWFEELYASSFVLRLVLHKALGMNRQFIFPWQLKEKNEKAEQVIKQSIEKFASLCALHNIRCTFVFIPSYGETTEENFGLKNLLQYSASHYRTVNLFSFFTRQGVNASNMNEYYWPYDTHLNNKGYVLVAEGIKPYVLEE